jgi:EpsI family protein
MNVIVPAVALALLAVACAPGLLDMPAGWLAWRARDRLRRLPTASAGVGLVALLAAAPLAVVALVEDVALLANGAFLLGLVGLCLLFLGAARTRVLAPPLALLAFMVPLPGFALDGITFHLKLLAARLAAAAFDLLGVPAILEGGTLHFARVSVTVADACSGVRTLVSLCALGALFACLQPSAGRSVVVAALAGPLAIVANLARVLLLCGIALTLGPDALRGALHDLTGVAVYAVALTGLLAVHRPGDEPAPPAEAPPPWTFAAPSRGRVAVVLGVWAALAAASLTLGALRAAAAPPPSTELATSRVPRAIGAWTGIDIPLSERVYEVLKTKDAVMRRYSRPGVAGAVDLYVTHSAEDIFRIAHAPERCFTGTGHAIAERGETTLSIGDRLMAVNRMVFVRSDATTLVFAWYRVQNVDVPDYTRYRLDTFMRQVRIGEAGGSMIRLSTSVDVAGMSAAEARVRTFCAEALGPALAPLEQR